MAVTAGGETWSFARRDGVGVWTIEDIEAFFEREVEDGERHFRRTVSAGELDGAVVVLDDTSNISAEMQAHVSDAWSAVIAAVELERLAFVAAGVRAMAVKANVEVPDTELKALNEVDEAVEWVRAG